MKFDYPLSVSVLIVNDAVEILHVSRKDDHEAWGLPGGKVDPGETMDQAAVRECLEETGAEVELIEVVHSGIIPPTRPDPNGRAFYNITYTARLLSEPRQMPGEGLVARHKGWDRLISGPFGEYNQRVHDELVEREAAKARESIHDSTNKNY